MKRFVALGLVVNLAILNARLVEARQMGVGIDAFNRVASISMAGGTVFSPASFEIDSVLFAEAVDPIRRSQFTDALHVLDEFKAEYSSMARHPYEQASSNGVDLVWLHAFVMEEPRRVNPAYRSSMQDLYAAEICPAKPARGVEAWVHARFAGSFDNWRLPPLPKGEVFAFHDLVSVSVKAVPTNGWRRVCATHTLYHLPLVGGCSFYALTPKEGRAMSSVRPRLTSVTLPDMLAASSAVIDPPEPLRLALPPVDLVATNELAGAFSYFRFQTGGLKQFPSTLKPNLMRQTMRFRVETPAKPEPGVVTLEGPFLFFIHDPVAKTLPVVGVVPGKGGES